MTKSVIKLGFIGIVDSKDDPLLQSIQLLNRFRLSAAFSPCYQKLDSFAKQLKIAPVGSCRQLTSHSEIDGLIWNCDAAEYAVERLGLGISAKHFLIRSDVLQELSLERILKLQECATSTQTEILPELLHRWTPVTLRLRELIATQLGPIEEIKIEQGPQQSPLFNDLFHIIDWLRMLLSLNHCTVESNSVEAAKIISHRPEQKSIECKVNLFSANDDMTSATAKERTDSAEIHIRCQSGKIEINSVHAIRWQTESAWNEESLDSERTADQVMLDLFGRRIAGGIVPVPDLMEVLRTQRVLAAIEKSQLAGRSVQLDDTSLPVHNGEFSF